MTDIRVFPYEHTQPNWLTLISGIQSTRHLYK